MEPNALDIKEPQEHCETSHVLQGLNLEKKVKMEMSVINITDI